MAVLTREEADASGRPLLEVSFASADAVTHRLCCRELTLSEGLLGPSVG
jgi:hypothetical protein